MKYRYWFKYFEREIVGQTGWKEKAIKAFHLRRNGVGVVVENRLYRKAIIVDLNCGTTLRWDYNQELPAWIEDPLLRAMVGASGTIPNHKAKCPAS